MASYTTNLNLKKPAGSENVAIGDINNNMDAIDAAYGTLNDNLSPIKNRTGLATISSSTPAQFNIGSSYGVVVLMGLFQGIGTKIFIFVVSGGTVTIKDYLAGTDYTDTGMTASYSNNILSISQSYTGAVSKVTFIQSRQD